MARETCATTARMLPTRVRTTRTMTVTETRASRSLWLSEADVYLDASVRSAPGSPYAARAYDLLERTLSEPELTKKTRLSPGGARRASRSASSLAGRDSNCVR